MTKKCNIFMAFLKSFAILIASSMITLAIQGMFKSEDLGTLFGYVVCIAGLYGIYRNKIKEDIKNFKDDLKKYFPKTLLISTILIILEMVTIMMLTIKRVRKKVLALIQHCHCLAQLGRLLLHILVVALVLLWVYQWQQAQYHKFIIQSKPLKPQMNH